MLKGWGVRLHMGGPKLSLQQKEERKSDGEACSALISVWPFAGEETEELSDTRCLCGLALRHLNSEVSSRAVLFHFSLTLVVQSALQRSAE